MKKKLLIIMTVLLAAFLVFGMIACSDYVKPDDDKDDADTITRTQIVTNGTFYNATSSNKDDYLKGTVSGWTATRGSLTTSANGVAMGVVDLSNEESYNLNKDKFFADGNVSNPGIDPNTPFDTDVDGNLTDKKQDSNALVVASKTTAGSLYYKNSTSFTLEAGKYYLLQYSVYTKIDMTDVEEADKAKKGGQGRYAAVNLQNYSTVEFRIFRGTLKHNALIAALELVNEICDLAIHLTDEGIEKMSWSEFVETIEAPELIQYLKERKLYVNETIEIQEEM